MDIPVTVVDSSPPCSGEEQNNQLVTLDHHARSTGYVPFSEVNVSSSSYNNWGGYGRGRKLYHGRGRGRGRRVCLYDERHPSNQL